MFEDSAYTDLIKKSKSGHYWCLLSLTDKEGDVTDERAIQYAMEKFNIPEDQVELKRTGGGILVRQKVENDKIDFLSFGEFVRDVYGVPTRDDPHYKEYKEFGYEVWLVNTFPKEWGTGDRGLFLSELEQDYHWYRLETFLGVELEDDLTVLEEFLVGKWVHSIPQRFPMDLPCEVMSDTFAVGIWDEGVDDTSVFIAIYTDDEMYLKVVPKTSLQKLDEKFGGFEDD